MRSQAVACRTGVLALTFALLAATPRASSAGATRAAEDPVYIPAGVIDAGATVACIRTSEGGVEAVDPAGGRSLWRAPAPARPLLVLRDRAFIVEEDARSNLRVAVYSTGTGRLLESYDLESLDLPPWASLAEWSEGRESVRFAVDGRLADGHLYLHYEVTLTRLSGFRGPEVADLAEGVARIDLDSGLVVWRAGPAPPRPPLVEPAPPLAGVRYIAVHARAPDATLMLGGPPPDAPGALVVGERRLAFELAPDTNTVIVHRWSASGEALESPVRLEHRQPTDAVWGTLDRRHVLLRRAGDQSRYDLFSLETGARMGKLRYPADVAVHGERVYWTTRETDGSVVLHAGAAATGRRVWRRTVSGPEPPPGPPIP